MTFHAAMYKDTPKGPTGLYNRAVRLWEHGPYSHGEMVFSDGWSASSSFMDGGVRFKWIDFDPEKWDIIELPAHLEADCRAWFVAHNGWKYDLMGNAHFINGLIPNSYYRKFCSEAMLDSLGVEGAWRFGPNSAASVLRFINKFGTLPTTSTN